MVAGNEILSHVFCHPLFFNDVIIQTVIHSNSQVYKKYLLRAKYRARCGDMALNEEKLPAELAI